MLKNATLHMLFAHRILPENHEGAIVLIPFTAGEIRAPTGDLSEVTLLIRAEADIQAGSSASCGARSVSSPPTGEYGNRSLQLDPVILGLSQRIWERYMWNQQGEKGPDTLEGRGRNRGTAT